MVYTGNGYCKLRYTFIGNISEMLVKMTTKTHTFLYIHDSCFDYSENC